MTEWIEGNYSFRKSAVITAPDADQTNYQLKLHINRSVGTSNGTNVYIGTNCETDYDDIRFTDNSGTYLLDYWIESSNTASATVWVEVGTIPTTTGTTIYMYYGDSTSSSWTNAASTFLQYVGATTAVDSADSFSKPLKYVGELYSTATTHTIRGGIYSCPGGNTNCAEFNSIGGGDLNYYIYNAANGNTEGSLSSKGSSYNETFQIEIKIVSNSFKMYKNGVSVKSYAGGAVPTSDYPMGLRLVTTGGRQNWSFLAKYTSTEPTFAAWGSQEGVHKSIIGKYDIELTPTNGDIIGKYDVFQSGNLISKYTIAQSQNSIGKYDIDISQFVIGKYNILPKHGDSSFRGTWSKYVIEIFDPILTEGQFNNLKIRKRLSQIPIATLNVVNPSATIIAQLIYNAPIRIRINGRLLFTGVLKRIEKDENVPIYHLFCEGGACILRDINITETTHYEHYGSYYIIDDLLLPATNWENLTESWNYIDYTVTPGESLSHITNICKMEGFDWDVRQANRTVSIIDISGDDITVDGDALVTGYYNGRYGALNNGAAANSGFTILSQTGNVLTVDEVPDGAAVGDSVILWGKYYFITSKPDSSTATVDHFVINKNAHSLNRRTNADKIITSITGVGQNPEVARTVSWATACTLNFATLVTDESYLSKNATGTLDTFFWIKDTSTWTDTGTLLISDEKITYTNKSATGVGPCTRGYDGTTATIHYIGDDVLFISSLKFTPNIPSGFPDAGSFWLGTELIDYTSRDNEYFYNLTRGASSSDKYRHHNNVYAFDYRYSDTNPEALSPVGLYGLQKRVIAVTGATTHAEIDRSIHQILSSNNNNVEYGDFSLLSSDFWHDVDVGNYIKFTDKLGTDNIWRITGVDYEQYKPVKVYFGLVDDEILGDIASIGVVSDVAREKNENARIATVTATVSTGKMVQVTYDDDGTSGWVKIP